MFENKKISEMQKHGAQTIKFDPDSSPEAWEHYQRFYTRNEHLKRRYNFSKLHFYNYFDTVGLKTGYFDGEKWFNYVNRPLKNTADYNRLFVLQRDTQTDNFNDSEYVVAANRLGGDCDFNFNEKKYTLFLEIIRNDSTASQREKDKAIQQLSKCREMHHTLLNFSLMQEAIGNMQKFKGNNRYDRLDTFIYELDKYYRGISNSILQFSSPNNEPALISFLDDFKDIYEYCATFYFITEKPFIDEIIKQGSMSITNVNELVRYMNLAESYWSKKELYFLKNEFLTVGNYFQNSGEAYSRNELISKIENDLGFCKEDCNKLIRKCEERGFLTPIGNDVFTR